MKRAYRPFSRAEQAALRDLLVTHAAIPEASVAPALPCYVAEIDAAYAARYFLNLLDRNAAEVAKLAPTDSDGAKCLAALAQWRTAAAKVSALSPIGPDGYEPCPDPWGYLAAVAEAELHLDRYVTLNMRLDAYGAERRRSLNLDRAERAAGIIRRQPRRKPRITRTMQ